MICDHYEPSRLNKVTEQLLKLGYTKERTPPGMNDWNFFYGGWTFDRDTLRDMTFETPCGLLVSGGRFLTGNLSLQGVDWMPENDNPTVTCPYFNRPECGLVHELLRGRAAGAGGGETLRFCNCHLSERAYSYEQSLDKAHDDVWREAETLWQRFSDERNGRVCRLHSRYNRRTKQWSIHYDPFVCTWGGCPGGHCPILDRELSPRKANIYYDKKTTWTLKGEGMLPDEEKVRVEKGVKLLTRPVSETICEAIVKYANVAERIRFQSGRSKAMLDGETHKVMNVRVERRAHRDLRQDLQDIAEGIEVVHASDLAAAAKAEKRERRKKAAAGRVRRLEKLIRERGYDGLDIADQRRADKLLDAGRIQELEQERQTPFTAEEQTSLFEQATAENDKREEAA